jgi:hypothetical protein
MTVVIGLAASKNLVFASDGFAIYQDDINSPTYKLDTHNKIRLLGNGKFILGSAGAHLIEFEISNSLEKIDFKGHSEKEFLEYFSIQVRNLNQNKEGKRTSFIIGYFNNEEPRLFLFQHDGKFVEQPGIATLGSGSDLAIKYLCSYYDSHWKIKEAVDHVVRAIFEASRIPTVNCLPMISILSNEGSLDLSQKAISMFQKFKDELRHTLVNQASLHDKKLP